MKYRNHDESWRERCIRLIALEPDERGYRIVGDPEDASALFDLCGMGYVRGTDTKNSVGSVVEFRTMGSTLAGRLFAEEQQRIIDGRSVWGRIKSGAGLALGWIAGVISSLLVYYVTKNG